jgi:CheY-like chemotaxis protein
MIREEIMSDPNISVLLVDDDPDACAIFKLVMDHYQLPLKVVGDATTALTYLETNDPNIIVIDIMLPGTDGYQTLHQIRKIRAKSNCHFIATTAYYTSDTSQEVINRGFDGYIPKPFESAKLVSYLRSFVSGESLA